MLRSPIKQALTVACRACDPRPPERMRSLDCSPTRCSGAKYLNNQTLRPKYAGRSITNRLKLPKRSTGFSPILVGALLFCSLQPFTLQFAMHLSCVAYARQCCLQYPSLWVTIGVLFPRLPAGEYKCRYALENAGNSARTGVMYVAAHMQ